MQFKVTLVESQEGFAVSCPALRGCLSQGATREEALANVPYAIRGWLDVEAEDAKLFRVSEEEVTV